MGSTTGGRYTSRCAYNSCLSHLYQQGRTQAVPHLWAAPVWRGLESVTLFLYESDSSVRRRFASLLTPVVVWV